MQNKQLHWELSWHWALPWLRLAYAGAIAGVLGFLIAPLGCTRPDKSGATEPVETTGQSSHAAPPDRPISKPAAPKPSSAKSNGQQTRSKDGSGPGCVAPWPDASPPPAPPAADCPADPDGNLDLALAYVTFVDAPGKPRIGVEHAEDTPARQRGLMYRTHMNDDEGMLFTFPGESIRSFWMKNTCIPLDMIFIDKNGYIVGILEQVPTLNLQSRRVPCPAHRVLEVNAGWTREHGVKPGQRLLIET